MTIATTTTLQAPLEETLAFVSYHLRADIDHMYLFFEDPDDEAVPILQDHARLTCVPCDQAHWENLSVEDTSSVQRRQKANATHAFRRAKGKRIDWVAHVDSDEFLHFPNSATEYFSTVSSEVEVVLFPVLKAVPQRFEYDRPF